MTCSITLADQFVEACRKHRRVLIGTHLNPDGDALGSALAMSLYLDEIGVQNEVVCNNLAPYNLKFLPHVDRVKLEPEQTDYQLGIVLDLDSTERLGRTKPYFESCEELIVIDHHVPHEEPGTLRIVDVEAPATSLILARLFRTIGAPITHDMATCLLAGIVTDTGSFRYRNTTPESLHTAADLLVAGGDIVEVCEEVYQKKPLHSVRLLGRTLDHLQLAEENQIAWSTLSARDFVETGANEENTEGLVNELLAVDTVQMAALIREPRVGKVRASLRSREGYDVAAVAREFGGGGHRNAAGCTFEVSLDQAERQLVEALKRCLASS